MNGIPSDFSDTNDPTFVLIKKTPSFSCNDVPMDNDSMSVSLPSNLFQE